MYINYFHKYNYKYNYINLSGILKFLLDVYTLYFFFVPYFILHYYNNYFLFLQYIRILIINRKTLNIYFYNKVSTDFVMI